MNEKKESGTMIIREQQNQPRYMTLITDMVERMGLSEGMAKIFEDNGFGAATASIEAFDGSTYRLFISAFATGVIDVEVSKKISPQDDPFRHFTLLKAINELNKEADGLTYYLDDQVISVKTTCRTGWDADVAYQHIMATMSAAVSSFPNFE